MYSRLSNFFQAAQESESSSVGNLPEDLKKHILSFIDSVTDLDTMARLSKGWEKAANHYLSEKYGGTHTDLVHDVSSAKRILRSSNILVYYTGDDFHEYKKIFDLPRKRRDSLVGCNINGIEFDPVFSEKYQFYLLCRDYSAEGERRDTNIKHIVLVHLSKPYPTHQFRKMLNVNNDIIHNIEHPIHINPETLLLFVLDKKHAQQFKEIPMNAIIIDEDLFLEDIYERVAQKLKEISLLELDRKPYRFCNIS